MKSKKIVLQKNRDDKDEPVNIDIISSRSGVGPAALLKFLLDPGERVGERVLLQHCLKKSPRVRNG